MSNPSAKPVLMTLAALLGLAGFVRSDAPKDEKDLAEAFARSRSGRPRPTPSALTAATGR